MNGTSFLALLKPLGVDPPVNTPCPFLSVPEVDQKSADNKLKLLVQDLRGLPSELADGGTLHSNPETTLSRKMHVGIALFINNLLS